MRTCGRSLFFIAVFFSPAWINAGDPPVGNPALINVQQLAPNIRVEMRYATSDNFTKSVLYDTAVCLLNESAAKRLARVQLKLEKEGLGLKVWDCYRPLDVQQKLWDIVPDPRYVGDPKKGSRHNRGASVDLTLVDRNGKELEMPTAFDDFSEKAHRNYWKLSRPAIRNREKLQWAMESEGFSGLPAEWWHFDDPHWQSYALRNEPLSSTDLLVDQMTGTASFTLPTTSGQVLLVLTDGWDAVPGKLIRFEKTNGVWEKMGTAIPVAVGLKGMAWGQGLHNAQDNGPQKKEGDLKATAGVFAIGKAYGYAPAAIPGSKWPYQPVDETWRCVDDPASPSYNQIKSVPDGTSKDFVSAEKMKRSDHLYSWVLNIEQNMPNVLKGCGSCIFLHVWRNTGSGTEGCTAMPEEKMVELLKWLDPAKKPLIVQLPQAEYARLKDSWKLP